jgi:hypothetical protein
MDVLSQTAERVVNTLRAVLAELPEPERAVNLEVPPPSQGVELA